MSDKKYLNKEISARELAQLRRLATDRILETIQDCTVGAVAKIQEALAPVSKAGDMLEDAPTLYAMLAIYASLQLCLDFAREATIQTLGGYPQGEAQMRYWEEKMDQTILKIIRDEDFAGMGFRRGRPTSKKSED
jgi:hypothetical protein